MAGVEQPTNATAPRQETHGERAAIEEQEQAVPTGPEQRGRPAEPQDIAPAPPSAFTRGTVSEVMPGNDTPPVSPQARMTTRDQEIAIAILGMGAVSPITRRLAMALEGIPQQGIFSETLPRDLPNTSVVGPVENEEPVLAQEEMQGAPAEQAIPQPEVEAEGATAPGPVAEEEAVEETPTA